jgi:NAD(P)-dependent dehydrogenase (short-subunit alcohol dehydrogenase family)
MATVDNNATKDGFDNQMQTNHLSHFLLASRVWSLLETAQEKRGDARVVNHSSGARTMGNKKLEEKYLGKNGGNLAVYLRTDCHYDDKVVPEIGTGTA